MNIPDAYLAVINPLIAKAKEFLEKGETLAPIAFVGNFTSGQIVPVILDTSGAAAKDHSMRAVRMAAEATDADFIFIIMEAWSLRKDKLAQYEDIMNRYGSIGESPYCEDVASFSLETMHGVWVATAPIKSKPPSKKRRTFAPFDFMFAEGVEGRLVGLLKKKEADTGSLH